MKPVLVKFYAYAENDTEAIALEQELRRFVTDHYNRGILVTAEKMTKALMRFGNNIFVTNYLK